MRKCLTLGWLLSGAILAGAQQQAPGIIAAYAANRYEGIGNYVTHDAILMGHGLCLEEAVAQAEETLYAPQVKTIVQELSAAAAKALASPATDANRQFLAVLGALISGEAAEAAPAKQEVEKILAAQDLSRSALFPETVDYTQFKVRGHYARTPELGRYFQTVRYAGTVLFAVKDSAATGISARDADQLTAQAMQLAGWISASPKASAAYKSYVSQTGLLFGDPDDLILSDLTTLASHSKDVRAALFAAARKTGRQPQVIGGLVDLAKLEPGVTAQDALTGWRFFPQRRSPDGVAFQQLLFPNTGVYQGTQKPHSLDVINGQSVKAFPLAMELPSLLGSAAAVKILNASDERNYKGYGEAFVKAQKSFVASSRPPSWVPVMRTLLGTKTSSQEQLLATTLAYWTRNRHRGLLYEKQTYTPVVKGMALTQPRTTAYLEPSTAVYHELLVQTQAMSPALKPETGAGIRAILEKCIAISTKESAGAALSPSDVAFLNDIDQEFMKIAGREDLPIVVDMHTNPSSQQVLEEAVGYVHFEEFKTLRGARLSHFEFRQPMNQRMTDEEWQIRARKEKP